ncbi:MAG: ABC transporter permease, partial [Verrucomicrobiales bacterium]
MNGKINKPRERRWLISIVPSTVWLFLFLFLPFLSILGVSFLSRGGYGEIEQPLTLENYARLAGYSEFGFDSSYPAIFGRSILLAGVTSIFCALFALPLAFFIASLKGASRTIALILVVIPVW